MRRILLVAEGTLDRPPLNVLAIVVGMTIILVCGFLIVTSGLPGPLVVAAVVVLVVAVAWAKARFGGQREFRVEKRAEGGPLRIAGRFEEGHVGSGHPRELVTTEIGDNALWFEAGDDAQPRRFHLRPPAFSTESLQMLHEAIGELRALDPDEIASRFGSGDRPIRYYDAKKVVLLRFQQKPGYMMILWLIAGLTVLFWFVMGPVIYG